MVDTLLRSFRAVCLITMHVGSESQSQHNTTTSMRLFNSLWHFLAFGWLHSTVTETPRDRLHRLILKGQQPLRVMTVGPILKFGRLTHSHSLSNKCVCWAAFFCGPAKNSRLLLATLPSKTNKQTNKCCVDQTDWTFQAFKLPSLIFALSGGSTSFQSFGYLIKVG